MAHLSHKRDTNARRKPRAALVAGPLAVLATASAVSLGVLTTASPVSHDVISHDVIAKDAAVADISGREVVSRSDSRLDATVNTKAERKKFQRAFDANMSRTETLQAVRGADTKLWTTTLLNLWTGPGKEADKSGLLKSATHVLVTGRKAGQRVELAVDGKSRWVTAGYLAKDKPKPEKAPEAAATTRTTTAGLSNAPCPDSSTESGLTSNAVLVYRAVCHAFPQITTYGGYDAHGEHASGRAIDIMNSDVGLGNAIAAFLRAHASELHLYDVIWRQQIWTPVRASEGWRYMPSRGSTTANHYDHVHVSVY